MGDLHTGSMDLNRHMADVEGWKREKGKGKREKGKGKGVRPYRRGECVGKGMWSRWKDGKGKKDFVLII